MWRTPKGTRIVAGPESVLFRETIEMMIDELLAERECEDFNDMQTTYRVKAYDDLSLMQRLGLLHDVARALLLKDVPPPKLTAVNEATLAAIINNVEQLIWFEIDSEDISETEVPRDKCYWRGLLVACNDAHDGAVSPGGEDEYNIDVASPDYGDWDIEIQVLSDRFLWDIDYEYTDIPDLPPERAEAERRRLDIDPDYYTALPPDPDDEEFDLLLKRIRTLCKAAP